jgi:hypothetical protein
MVGVGDPSGQGFIHQSVSNSLNVLTRHTKPTRDLWHCFPPVRCRAEYLPSGLGLSDSICDGFAAPPEGAGQLVDVRDEQRDGVRLRVHLVRLSKWQPVVKSASEKTGRRYLAAPDPGPGVLNDGFGSICEELNVS